VNFLTARRDCFLAGFRDSAPERGSLPCFRLKSAAIPLLGRLFPLISRQIPLFGGTANFASDSNEINYFEASGWACERPEWALFPAFSRAAGNPVVVFGPSPRQVLVTFTMGGRARWRSNRC
jgi:hypothetical protein